MVLAFHAVLTCLRMVFDRPEKLPGVRLVGFARLGDVVCINLCDLRERGQQVQLMRAIFSQADITWVWLGVEECDSDKAMELIDLLAYICRDCYARSADKHHLNVNLWGPRDSWQIDSHFFALENLLTRPWWHRIWVVQEVAVSKRVRLHCGNCSTTWANVVDTVRFYRFVSHLLLRQPIH